MHAGCWDTDTPRAEPIESSIGQSFTPRTRPAYALRICVLHTSTTLTHPPSAAFDNTTKSPDTPSAARCPSLARSVAFAARLPTSGTLVLLLLFPRTRPPTRLLSLQTCFHWPAKPRQQHGWGALSRLPPPAHAPALERPTDFQAGRPQPACHRAACRCRIGILGTTK